MSSPASPAHSSTNYSPAGNPGPESPYGDPRLVRTERWSSAGRRAEPFIVPIILLAAGLGLALLDLVSPEASGMLRVPALIAALLLTADAITQLEQAFEPPADHVTVVEQQEEEIVDDDGNVVHVPSTGTPAADPRHPGRAYHGPVAAEQVVVVEEDADASGERRRPNMAYAVLGLAVWLGLASLASTTATDVLRLLTLFAAVLIFKRGWDVVGPRRS